MAWEHLVLKFEKRLKIIIMSKPQRYKWNNSGRLKADLMQVCLPQFRKLQSFRCSTRVRDKKSPILSTYPHYKLQFNLPLRIEMGFLVCLESWGKVPFPIKISFGNLKNYSFYRSSKLSFIFPILARAPCIWKCGSFHDEVGKTLRPVPMLLLTVSK